MLCESGKMNETPLSSFSEELSGSGELSAQMTYKECVSRLKKKGVTLVFPVLCSIHLNRCLLRREFDVCCCL